MVTAPSSPQKKAMEKKPKEKQPVKKSGDDNKKSRKKSKQKTTAETFLHEQTGMVNNRYPRRTRASNNRSPKSHESTESKTGPPADTDMMEKETDAVTGLSGQNLDEKMKAVDNCPNDPIKSAEANDSTQATDDQNYSNGTGDEDEDEVAKETDTEATTLQGFIGKQSGDRSYAALAATTLAFSDDSSAQTAPAKTQAKKLVRLFLSMRVYPNDKEPRWVLRFTRDANRFMNACKDICPEFRLAEWSATDATDAKTVEKAIHEVQPRLLFIKKYFWAGMKHNKQQNISATNGVKWLRVNALLPFSIDLDDFFDKMENNANVEWWEFWDNYICVTPCQAPDPFQIGWLLRSTDVMINCDDFMEIIRDKVGDYTLGLEWKDIPIESSGGAVRQNMRRVRKKQSRAAYYKTKVQALLIECSYGKLKTVKAELDRLYNIDNDYPLNISMAFIHSLELKEMRPKYRRDGYKKCMLHQRLFLEQVDSVEIPVRDIDLFMKGAYHTRTFREFLSNVLVRTNPEFRNDFVWLSVNRYFEENNPDQMLSFVYHTLVEDEAVSLATNLPLFLETEFGIDSSLYFDIDVIMSCKRGKKWNEHTRRAVSRAGKDIFGDPLGQYGDKILQLDAVDEELTEKDEQDQKQLDFIHKVIFARAQNRCEETIVNGRDSTDKRVVSMTGRQLNVPQADGDDVSINSGLSEQSTGNMDDDGSVNSSATTESQKVAAYNHGERKTTAKFQKLMADQQEAFANQISSKDEQLTTLSEQLRQMQSNQADLLQRIEMISFQTSSKPVGSTSTTVPPTPIHPRQSTDKTAMTPGPGSAPNRAVAK